jgi:YaiO family outer membrane protein
MIKRFAAVAAAVTGLCLPLPLLAQSSQTVTATAETQEFSDDFGSLRTVTLEYKFVNDDTTVVFTPAVGERRAPGFKETAVGAGAAIYHDWSDIISSRTSAFVAENAPVFAQYDFAQDLTAKVGKNTTATIGGRYARYFGDQDVVFLSAGVRQYFRFGSVAYRLTRVDPEGRDGYFAHLVNVSVKDPKGAGKTQLWLSAGEASISGAQVPDNLSGDDYAAVLQRVQPIGGNLALVPTLGYSSYDRPTERIAAVSLGLGLSWTME